MRVEEGRIGRVEGYYERKLIFRIIEVHRLNDVSSWVQVYKFGKVFPKRFRMYLQDRVILWADEITEEELTWELI